MSCCPRSILARIFMLASLLEPRFFVLRCASAAGHAEADLRHQSTSSLLRWFDPAQHEFVFILVDHFKQQGLTRMYNTSI
ncbi:hypothetical protein BGW80DRAFT_1308495 [Lactifluus volemus]|nr:hypothetical protein BGW80DRAFT_1308495 [Lactifluus volemus]